jgi:hypothetical protein
MEENNHHVKNNKSKASIAIYIYIYIYVYAICHLDGPIHLDQPTGQPTEPMAYVPDRSNPACPGTGQSPRALTHTSQPFSIFAQSFGASVNHFLVSLSNLVIANSAIFGIVNSVILATVNSTILAVELSHFMILPAILQERLVIPHCYSTQPFLLHCSSILTTVLSHFVFCYSELSHFCYHVSRFSLLQCSAIFQNCSVIFKIAIVLSHLLNRSVIFVWSGTRGSVGVARGSINYVCTTEPRRGARSRRTEARGVGCVPGSVGPLERWVYVMDLWSITLGDE